MRMHPIFLSVPLTTLHFILSLPSTFARPSYIDTIQAVGTDIAGATLEVCRILSSVDGEEGNMMMSSTVYMGDSSGEELAILNITFPESFTTPDICWPSEDINQPPFYLQSDLMEYEVITHSKPLNLISHVIETISCDSNRNTTPCLRFFQKRC